MIDQNQKLDLLAPIEFTNLPVSAIRDEHSPAPKCERFIAFYFGRGLYCVPADQVAEVIHPLPVSVLPNSPRGVTGIVAIRGEVITVLNLKELVHEAGGPPQDKSKLIVLRLTENQTQFAIPADRMREVVMLPAAASDPNMGSDLVRRAEHEGIVYNIIETEKLSAEIARQI